MAELIVIGGGLAGLAAAARLGRAGVATLLLEAKPRFGGRAGSFTDPTTGQLIDACQHVSMGCCTAFAEFCREVGIDHLLTPQRELYFRTPDRRESRLWADPLPAPLHLARAFALAHFLTFGEKLRVGWGLARLRFTPADGDEPLRDWLLRHGQTPRTIARFWAPVLVSALNESIDRLGLKYARKVFVDGFLTDRRGFEVQLPAVPLDRLYGAELADWLARHGVRRRTNSAVGAIEFDGDRVTGVRLRDGESIAASAVIAAVPFDRLLDLVPAAWHDREPFRGLKQLEVSPITSVHVWTDRPYTDRPHVVLLETLGQWLFNRGEVSPGCYYVQVVISAARDLGGNSEIQRQVLAELERLYPVGAKVVRSRVVTERSATFSAVPGVDRWRPGATIPGTNLYLAGDWTATGWPATMEGAVRGGRAAADAYLSDRAFAS